MLKNFLNFARREKLFGKTDKILLAVSGGRDSVALAELFSRSGTEFCIAHCNFLMRGVESDGDEKFTRQLARRLGVPFFVKHLDVKSEAKKKKISIQMAARDLRYKWFEELLKKEKFTSIAVAHHQDDAVETFFINLMRGSGLAGLQGIKAKHGNVIRPLLFAGRNAVNAYIKENKISYREDSSNREDKYIRNKLRLKIIPLLKEINPGLNHTILETADRLARSEEFIQETIRHKFKRIKETREGRIQIPIKELNKHSKLFLHTLLSPFGFNNELIDEINLALDSQPGKWFYSDTHRLLKDREYLVLEKKMEETKIEVKISKSVKRIASPFPVSFMQKKYGPNLRIPVLGNVAWLNLDKLKFPLTIRKWSQGDSFIPLGMKGRKKLSDFFIDNKLSGMDKNKVWVLVSGEAIVWVIGHRIDERYKIQPTTKEILVCTIEEMYF